MALRGEEGWHRTHAESFGIERWQALHGALHRDPEHLLFASPFLSPGARKALDQNFSLRPSTIPGAYLFDVPEGDAGQLRVVDSGDESVVFVDSESEGLAPFFLIDGASMIAAWALGVEEGDRVLDMCAAPGGKALVLAAVMFGHRFSDTSTLEELRGWLVVNEASRPLAAAMQRAMAAFLPSALLDPAATFGPHVIFTTADLGTPSNSMERRGPFDRILLDSPCTSDRHMLRRDPDKLRRWSVGTSKVSSERQLKLLRSALWLLREGGVILYCTTSLSREECDGVVEQLICATRSSFELEILHLADDVCRMVPCLGAEPTDLGTRILPDRTALGPLYFSKIRMTRRLHEAVRHLPG